MPQERRLRVLISYSRQRSAAAEHLQASLERVGIAVWRDLRNVDAGVVFPDDLHENIAATDVVVALISPPFLSSAVCSGEAYAAMARSLREGILRYVPVVVLDGEKDKGFDRRSLPRALRVESIPEWDPTQANEDGAGVVDIDAVTHAARHRPLTTSEFVAFVSARATHAAEAIPAAAAFSPVRRMPASLTASALVGRFEEQLALWGFARAVAGLDNATHDRQRTVVLTGLGGMGKSAIALKMATEYRDAFPGGTLWISAGGDGVRNAVTGFAELDEVAAKIERSVREWTFATAEELSRVGSAPVVLPPHRPGVDLAEQMRDASVRLRTLAEHLGRQAPHRHAHVLWIFDDVPKGASDIVRSIEIPESMAMLKVVTARELDLEALYPGVRINPMKPQEAVRVLAHNNVEGLLEPDSEAYGALEALAGAVGNYPLALGVLQRRLLRSSEKAAAARALTVALAAPSGDARTIAQTNLDLPTGHESSIVETIVQSLRLAVNESPDDAETFVRLLAHAPPEPFVPFGVINVALRAAGSQPRAQEIADVMADLGLVRLVSKTDLVGVKDHMVDALRGDGGEPGEVHGFTMHSVARMVCRAIVVGPAMDDAVVSRDLQFDRAICVAAASWYADRIDDLRNEQDRTAAEWARACFHMLRPYLDDLSVDESVVLGEALRAMARPEMRLSGHVRDSSGADSESPYWRLALDNTDLALTQFTRALAEHPDDRRLQMGHAEAQAMKGGLLNKRAAWLLASGYAEPSRALNDEALALVTAQWHTRTRLLSTYVDHDESAPDPVDTGLRSRAERRQRLEQNVSRSAINIPGPLINRAKQHRVAWDSVGSAEPEADRAATVAEIERELDRAAELYGTELRRRIELYGDRGYDVVWEAVERPLAPPAELMSTAATCRSELLEIAACHYGLAVVSYVRGNLTMMDRDRRTATLAEAVRSLRSALALRVLAEHEVDTSKTMQVAVKVAAAVGVLWHPANIPPQIDTWGSGGTTMGGDSSSRGARWPGAAVHAADTTELVERSQGSGQEAADAAVALCVRAIDRLEPAIEARDSDAILALAGTLGRGAARWLAIAEQAVHQSDLVTLGATVTQWQAECRHWLD